AMTQTPFEQFISLVEVDQKINSLNKLIKSLEQENAVGKQADDANRAALEKIKQKVHDMQKEVDSKELEMKTLDLQEADQKKKLETVANHKEYSSIKAEIDVLKKAQHGLEEGLMQAWNQLESARKELEAANQQYEQQHQKSQEQMGNSDAKIAEIQ